MFLLLAGVMGYNVFDAYVWAVLWPDCISEFLLEMPGITRFMATFRRSMQVFGVKEAI